MTPRGLAHRWLRLDAFYCAGVGVLALALCVPLGHWFGAPVGVVAAIGAATLVWAWLLARLAARPNWREPLRLVAAANVVASVAVAGLAALAPGLAPRLLLLAVAIEVAAFGAVQARTLLRAR